MKGNFNFNLKPYTFQLPTSAWRGIINPKCFTVGQTRRT